MALTETAALIIIFIGALRAFVLPFISTLKRRFADSFIAVRLDLGRFLALGLEFQWAAVATIRTALNYFLSREIQQERKEMSVDQV